MGIAASLSTDWPSSRQGDRKPMSQAPPAPSSHVLSGFEGYFLQAQMPWQVEAHHLSEELRVLSGQNA